MVNWLENRAYGSPPPTKALEGRLRKDDGDGVRQGQPLTPALERTLQRYVHTVALAVERSLVALRRVLNTIRIRSHPDLNRTCMKGVRLR